MGGQADLILEWCSLKGEGTLRSFDDVCRVAFGDSIKSSRLLQELELSGHVEVDWVRTGRWSVNPPVLSLIEGAGGNAALIGARSRSAVSKLAQLVESDVIVALNVVEQGPASPTAVFVAAPSYKALDHAAHAIGAMAKTAVRLEYMNALVQLEDALAAATSEFTASGIQAKRFNVSALRFEPCEIRFSVWRPGCYEQMSYGLHRYLFVDGEGKLHNVDRWLAIHAEINRVRSEGEATVVPLSWSSETESLFCDARAQLPIMWARAAVFCSGLLPIRHKDGRDGHFVDEYRGVLGATYNRIRDSLGYTAQEVDHKEVVTDAYT